MFSRLPEPDDRPFPAGVAPVNLVTFEVDFGEERPLASDDGVKWQKKLQAAGLKTVRLAQAKQNAIQMMVGQSIKTAQVVGGRDGWVVTLDDGASNSGLYSTGVNLERQNYPGFHPFRGECERVLDSTIELLQPKVLRRVALTYSNVLSNPDATDSGYWIGKVHPAFLGPVVVDELRLGYTQGGAIYSFEDADCVVESRIALQPDRVFEGCFALVFQNEAHVNDVKEFSRNEVMEIFGRLHVVQLKLFYALLDPAYVTELRSAKVG